MHSFCRARQAVKADNLTGDLLIADERRWH
jgi:hypothetical protein